MARTHYVYRDGKWVEKGSIYDTLRPQVHIIQDSMDATWHPADGKYYESKSEFRRVTKAHGCQEYGNVQLEDLKRTTRDPHSGLKEEIIRAWETHERRN